MSISEAFFNRNACPDFQKASWNKLHTNIKKKVKITKKKKKKKSADICYTLLAKLNSTTKGLGCQWRRQYWDLVE